MSDRPYTAAEIDRVHQLHNEILTKAEIAQQIQHDVDAGLLDNRRTWTKTTVRAALRSLKCRPWLDQIKPPKPKREEDWRPRARDMAFQRAMQEAIQLGLETAPIPHIDNVPTVPRIIRPALAFSLCGSPAGDCADRGDSEYEHSPFD